MYLRCAGLRAMIQLWSAGSGSVVRHHSTKHHHHQLTCYISNVPLLLQNIVPMVSADNKIFVTNNYLALQQEVRFLSAREVWM